MLRVAAAGDHAASSSLRNRAVSVSRGAGVLADVVEAGHVEGELAQDQQRPTVADDLERVGDRAHARPDGISRFA